MINVYRWGASCAKCVIWARKGWRPNNALRYLNIIRNSRTCAYISFFISIILVSPGVVTSPCVVINLAQRPSLRLCMGYVYEAILIVEPRLTFRVTYCFDIYCPFSLATFRSTFANVKNDIRMDFIRIFRYCFFGFVGRDWDLASRTSHLASPYKMLQWQQNYLTSSARANLHTKEPPHSVLGTLNQWFQTIAFVLALPCIVIVFEYWMPTWMRQWINNQKSNHRIIFNDFPLDYIYLYVLHISMYHMIMLYFRCCRGEKDNHKTRICINVTGVAVVDRRLSTCRFQQSRCSPRKPSSSVGWRFNF